MSRVKSYSEGFEIQVKEFKKELVNSDKSLKVSEQGKGHD